MNIQTVSTSTKNTKSRFFVASGHASAEVNSIAFSPINSNSSVGETIENRFELLKNDWVRETRFNNSLSEINESEALRSIISLGPSVVPFILKDLRDSPKHWFYALRSLTGANPIKKSDAGNLVKMQAAWFNWAAKKGIVY
jgi:hypothetical protein